MRNIPVITKNLLIINVLAFVAGYIFEVLGADLNSAFGLHFFMANDFHVFQFLTYMFLHGGFTHLFLNIFALWMFGCVIERTLGQKRFLTYYMVCGIGAGVIQELAQLTHFYFTLKSQNPGFSMGDIFLAGQQLSYQLNSWNTIGASGAVYGILLAFGMLYPEERIIIFPLPIPIKAKWFVAIYVVIELVSAYTSYSDGVAHMAHIGGMLFGFFLLRYWRRRPQIDFGSFFNKSFTTRFTPHHDEPAPTDKQEDWEYKRREKERQEEIDRILDKIRLSGYDSLTAEEKRKLFDKSHNG